VTIRFDFFTPPGGTLFTPALLAAALATATRSGQASQVFFSDAHPAGCLPPSSLLCGASYIRHTSRHLCIGEEDGRKRV